MNELELDNKQGDLSCILFNTGDIQTFSQHGSLTKGMPL